MMLPIPKAGVLEEVRGQAEAGAVPGVTGLEISIARGKAVRALPEADRYLGFLFVLVTDRSAFFSNSSRSLTLNRR